MVKVAKTNITIAVMKNPVEKLENKVRSKRFATQDRQQSACPLVWPVEQAGGPRP